MGAMSAKALIDDVTADLLDAVYEFVCQSVSCVTHIKATFVYRYISLCIYIYMADSVS